MLSRSFYQNLGSRSRYCYQITGVGSCKVHITAARGSASSAVTAPCDMVAGDVFSDLKPALLWNFFKDLTQIPRPSKHEQRILQYLKDFATERQLTWQQDKVGNLVIRRPGSGGGEAAPFVVIQGHVDMVCEKDPAVSHNFLTDPLVLRREGDWLKATGTTLGADNGIGVAAALALLACPSTTKLPPLECLFTVDEETGLTGAFQISPDLLTGRTLLNLDTEDWGEVFIGCAGGGDMRLVMQVALEPPHPDMKPYTLKLGGLQGGHSGLNIHEGRGNAVQLMARILSAVAVAAGPGGWQLGGLRGGDKRNAIARDAVAVVLVADDKYDAISTAVQTLLDELRTEYGTVETALSLSLTPLPGCSQSSEPAKAAGMAGAGAEAVLKQSDVDRLLALLRGLPHGPIKFSHAVPGLVETSNNVASIKEEPRPQPLAGPCPSNSLPLHRHYVITTSTRSSLMPALEATRDVIQGLARLGGCEEVVRGTAYPGWQPKLDSRVLQVTLDAYRELQEDRKTAKVGAIHAGLECGILGQKFPGLDMVSFGPTIKGAHSPEERVQISTVEPFWKLTLKVLEHLADVRH